MNKKIILLIACILVGLFAFTACNTYSQPAISGAELNAPVESNGGLVVKQGKHIYFINGYVGADADNTFGTPYKSALMRAELDSNNNIVADSQVVLTPFNIYSGSTESGIYILDGWMYFATPNTELDRDGNVNTTYLNFMRTKLDATKTEHLYTASSRSVSYAFANGRLLISDAGELFSIDLNAKKVDSEKNYVSIADRVSATKFIFNGGSYNDYVLTTRNLSDEDKGKTFNELWAIKADGSQKIKLIGGTSYTSVDTDVNNTYKIALLNYIVEGSKITLYYTKSITRGSGTATVTGVYSYTFDGAFSEIDKTKEKQLSYNTATTLTPIGENGGALVTESSKVTLIKAGENNLPQEMTYDEKTVIAKAVTVKFIKDGYVYYTATSSIAQLYRFKLDGSEVEQKVCDFTPLTTWIGSEVIGDYFYYLDSTTNYTYRYDLTKLDKKVELVGKMTAEDYKTYIEKDE